MAVDRIWVVVERQGDGVASLSLELLSKARSLAGMVEGITWGDAGGIAAEVGLYGAATLYTVGDLGGGLPGPVVAAAIAARVAAGEGPNAVLVPHSYDGRDIAARLSVRIDRPVLTNVVGLDAHSKHQAVDQERARCQQLVDRQPRGRVADPSAADLSRRHHLRRDPGAGQEAVVVEAGSWCGHGRDKRHQPAG
jgi:electron transfer flavoprotein alpha subunit